ncbi:MAG: nucleotide exchange factor GrpE [Eubacterium sp.]|nr:nucleotide exchange factor GrpE [Eubacterium sp.]
MSKKQEPTPEKERPQEQEATAAAQEEAVTEETDPVAAELADTKEKLLRTAAEYANYRARSAKEKELTFTNAKGTVIAEILPVIDNLERALSADSDYEALKKGVEMTMTGLMAALDKLGVEQYGEPGDTFDPNLHNAVMHIEDESLEENIITDVFQKGYKVGDRVVRPAMVKTAN